MQKLSFKFISVWIGIGLLIQYAPLYGQVLSGDANGKSTILFEGGNISFNLQEQAFDVAYNHFKNYRFRRNMDAHSIEKTVQKEDIVMPDWGRQVWGLAPEARPPMGLRRFLEEVI